MKIKNLNIRKKAVAMALAGTLSTTCLLSGCGNHQVIDTKRTFNKAIIFDYENKVALIIDVKSWGDYEGEQFQIQTSDNFWIVTSSYDTKLIDDRNSDFSAEDFARSIIGEDAEINYLNDNTKVRTR